MQKLQTMFLELKSRHPLIIYTVVFVDVFFYSMVMTMVFPFLPQLVKSYGVTELNTGFAVGAIGSSLYLGRLCFSMFWGWLADTIGKKRSLIATMVCLLVTTTVFGFSEGVYWAGVSRFLQGCCMGHLIILRSILGDVCDDSNISWGMGVINTSFSTGFILGPSITGFLAFPASQYPGTFASDSLFGRFVILLPIVVTVFGSFIGIVFSLVFLPDDANTSRSKSTVKFSSFVKEKRYFDYIDLDMIISPKVEETRRNVITHHAEYTRLLPPPRNKCRNLLSQIKTSKIFSVLKVKEFRYSCLLYGSITVLDIGFLQLFPTLAHTNTEHNGLNFTTSQTGAVMMTASLLLLPIEFLLLPKLNDRFGSKKVLSGTSLLLAFICPLLPVLAAIRSTSLLWTCSVVLIFLYRTCMYTGYLSTNILLNNSVQPSLIGCANGLGTTLYNVAWLVAPVGMERLYSWSLTNIKGASESSAPLGFPFNQYLAYFVLSLWAVCVAVVTSFIPDRMNRKAEKKPNRCLTVCAESI